MRVHVSLNVESLGSSIEFYSGLFGTGASKIRDGYANFRLSDPPIHLALMENRKSEGAGLSHLGVELPDADSLSGWRSRLESSGITFEIEDQAQCCYASADKLWLTDPDGYRWEVWVRTGEYEGMGC
jgi:catechol-2,3-dioxygenase